MCEERIRNMAKSWRNQEASEGVQRMQRQQWHHDCCLSVTHTRASHAAQSPTTWAEQRRRRAAWAWPGTRVYSSTSQSASQRSHSLLRHHFAVLSQQLNSARACVCARVRRPVGINFHQVCSKYASWFLGVGLCPIGMDLSIAINITP